MERVLIQGSLSAEVTYILQTVIVWGKNDFQTPTRRTGDGSYSFFGRRRSVVRAIVGLAER